MEALAENFEAQPFHAAGLAGRVDGVLARVRRAFPEARVGEVDAVDEGFPGARVDLRNGISVVVGVDLDLPDILFEVVRVYEPGETPRYAFEAHSANGWADTDKLSADAVLALLRDYARLPTIGLEAIHVG